ncbi:hypothetical protein I317_05864 [Kwoniella heveanensis CBS 569]|nr:hypothetical protein I317_05864 [Kwoniella heveanensis CBS 569]
MPAPPSKVAKHEPPSRSTQSMHPVQNTEGSTLSSSPTMSLPPEIFQHVLSFLDGKSQVNMMCASRDTYDRLAPIMYKRVTLTSENAWAFFRGMIRKSIDAHRCAWYNLPKIILAEEDFAILNIKTQAGIGGRPAITWPRFAWFEPDETDCAEDNIARDKNGRHSPPYITTLATHRRKLALLKFVKHLHVSSMPSRGISMHMCIWSALISGQRSQETVRDQESSVATGTLFSNVSTLCYNAEAYWQFANWVSYHGLRYSYQREDDDERPPFLRAMVTCAKPTHFCFGVPECDRDWYNEMLVEAAYAGRQMASGFEVVETCVDMVSQQLIESAMRGCRSLTIHRPQISQMPFGIETVRVFLPKDYYRSDGPWGRPQHKKVHKVHERLVRGMAKIVCGFNNCTLRGFGEGGYREDDDKPTLHEEKGGTLGINLSSDQAARGHIFGLRFRF